MGGLEDLWKTVHQTRDRGAIAVLADALVERGDPRGLFMQLMLAGGHTALCRAADLLEEHRASWLGAFCDLAIRGSDVWRDGVLRGFRPDQGAPWPVPSHPDWAGVEQLDLVSSGLEPALPVFDALHIPLRAVFGVASPEDFETLLCRTSPRTHLHHLSTTSWVRNRVVSAPMCLQVDVLEFQGPAVTPFWQDLPPAEVRYTLHQRNHRELTGVIDEALAIHQRQTAHVTVEHGWRGLRALSVALGTDDTSTLWIYGGELPVGWKALRRLAEADIPLQVVGEIPPALATRLERRCPGWLPSRDPPVAVEGAELRTLRGSWQLTRAFSLPTDILSTHRGESFVPLGCHPPALLDHFDSHRSGSLEPD